MTGFKIQSITAFISVGPDGDEGVLAMSMNGVMMPLVCADAVRVAAMLPMAEKIKKESGFDYKIVRFTCMIDITEETRNMFD